MKTIVFTDEQFKELGKLLWTVNFESDDDKGMCVYCGRIVVDDKHVDCAALVAGTFIKLLEIKMTSKELLEHYENARRVSTLNVRIV